MAVDSHSRLGLRYDGGVKTPLPMLTQRQGEARLRILKAVEGVDCHETFCVCGSTPGADIVLAQIERWRIPCRTVLCSACGLVRTNPQWPQEVLASVYKQFYWPLVAGEVTLTKGRFELSCKRSELTLSSLRGVVDLTGKRVLEIGCSYGAFLSGVQQSGASCVGYDYDEDFLAKGREFGGVDLRPGGLDAALRDGEEYDLVVLRHVFEHFVDPVQKAKSLAKLLRPEGRLFIEVPGVLNPHYWQPDPLDGFQVFHVFSYCRDTLVGIMGMAGYQCVACDENIYALFKRGGKETEYKATADVSARVIDFLSRIERRRMIRYVFSFPSHLYERLAMMWRQ